MSTRTKKHHKQGGGGGVGEQVQDNNVSHRKRSNKAVQPFSKNQEDKCLASMRHLIKNSGNELLTNNTWEYTDEFLLRYIRSRAYNVNSAFERLQNHMYVRRKKCPDIFARLYPSAIKEALDFGVAKILRDRDENGSHILYCRAGLWNPSDYSVDDLLISILMLGWEMLSFKETQLNGIVIIIDGEGFSLSQARHGTIHNIQKYTDLVVRASPFKCKGAHLYNAPLIANMTINLVKMFLPHKLKKRIHVHGSSAESLHKFIPASILPESLGGELTEEEAVNEEIMSALRGEERDAYYKSFTV